MFDTSNYLRQIFNSPLAIPTSQIAKLPMGEMEYICVGSGKPILILHGGVGGSDQAYLMFRKMIPDGYQLICHPVQATLEHHLVQVQVSQNKPMR